MKAFKEKSHDLQHESLMRKMINCSSHIMHYKRELIKIPILGFYSMTSSSALRRCRCDTYFSTINCSVVVCLQLKRTNQREHTTVPISRMHCPALITADAQRADGLTVRGN